MKILFHLCLSLCTLAWPRYQVLRKQELGQYNLEILSADLSDDSLYECQAPDAALRSRRAKLTVLSMLAHHSHACHKLNSWHARCLSDVWLLSLQSPQMTRWSTGVRRCCWTPGSPTTWAVCLAGPNRTRWSSGSKMGCLWTAPSAPL